MAGLPWIELHTSLPRHPKSIQLGVMLEDERAWTYMAQLWLWCAEGCPSGRIARTINRQVLECAAGWRGEPGRLADAAITCGFVNEDESGLEIHGWAERAYAHIAKLERDAERQRDRRARLTSGYVNDHKHNIPVAVTLTSNGHHLDITKTSKPNPRESQGDSNKNSNSYLKETFAGNSKSESPPVVEARKRKSRQKPENPTDPRHAPLVASLCATFSEVRRSDYGFNGKGAKQVSDLLALGDPIEIERRWHMALKHVGFPLVQNLAALIQHWDVFAGSGPPKKPNHGRASEDDMNWDNYEPKADGEIWK